MSNKLVHAVIGGVAGLFVYGVYKYLKNEKMSLEGAVGSIALGSLVGLTPDVVEPATNPNHRHFFHSLASLAILIFANCKGWQSEKLTDIQKLALLVASVGYGSHLLADCSTPKGLPLLT
jgi:membrane-bound metal-dependent hydrolase YbcI (DUF457 family)